MSPFTLTAHPSNESYSRIGLLSPTDVQSGRVTQRP